MPRTINSQIGSRVLTIEDGFDNFSTNATILMPNGDSSMRIANVPNAKAYARDRGGDATNPFHIDPSNPKTIIWWVRTLDGMTGQNDPYRLGVGAQDSDSVSTGAMQWFSRTSGNSFITSVSHISFAYSVVYHEPFASSLAWSMLGFYYNPIGSTYGTICPISNGVYGPVTPLPNTLRTIALPELSIGGRSNYSQSSVTSTPSDHLMGKLSVFNTLLTASQIASLYQAMLN